MVVSMSYISDKCDCCERYNKIKNKPRNKLYCWSLCEEYQRYQWKATAEYLGVKLDEQANKKETN